MKLWHDERSYDFTEKITNQYFTKGALFFDIETTGFSPARTNVYLIGCASRQGDRLIIEQFFAENPDDEKEVLLAFIEYLNHFDTLITFNGIGFDIPYLKGRFSHYHIADPFANFQFIDLFKVVSHLKFLLKLPNYKQKSVEAFLGIDRDDLFSGGELIEVYHDYCMHPSPEACHLLKLHNYEDVLGMPKLLPILSYQELFQQEFTITSICGNEYTGYDGSPSKELMLSGTFDFSVPCQVSCHYEDFYLTIKENQFILRIQLYEGELKYFFSDYKNYYYLPAEDIAIPKDVASSVDKCHRKNATAATCYHRKYAIFLPQYENLQAPAFRICHRDKKSFFELSEEFVQSDSLQQSYVKHIYTILSTKKGRCS